MAQPLPWPHHLLLPAVPSPCHRPRRYATTQGASSVYLFIDSLGRSRLRKRRNRVRSEVRRGQSQPRGAHVPTSRQPRPLHPLLGGCWRGPRSTLRNAGEAGGQLLMVTASRETCCVPATIAGSPATHQRGASELLEPRRAFSNQQCRCTQRASALSSCIEETSGICPEASPPLASFGVVLAPELKEIGNCLAACGQRDPPPPLRLLAEGAGVSSARAKGLTEPRSPTPPRAPQHPGRSLRGLAPSAPHHRARPGCPAPGAVLRPCGRWAVAQPLCP